MTIIVASLCLSIAVGGMTQPTPKEEPRVELVIEHVDFEHSESFEKSPGRAGILLARNGASVQPLNNSASSSKGARRSRPQTLKEVARSSIALFVMVDALRQSQGHFKMATRNLQKSVGLQESVYYATAISHHEAAIDALQKFRQNYPIGKVLDKLVTALNNHTAMIAITFNHGQFDIPLQSDAIKRFFKVQDKLNRQLRGRVVQISRKSQDAMTHFDTSTAQSHTFYQILSNVVRLQNPELAVAVADLVELGEQPTLLNDILNERQAKFRELGRLDSVRFPKSLVEDGEELLRLGKTLETLMFEGNEEAYQDHLTRFEDLLAQSDPTKLRKLLDASFKDFLAVLPSQFAMYTPEMSGFVIFEAASRTHSLFQRAQIRLENAVRMREESVYSYGRADVARAVQVLEDLITTHHRLKNRISKQLLEPLKSIDAQLSRPEMPLIQGRPDRLASEEFLNTLRSLNTSFEQFYLATSTQVQKVFGRTPKLKSALEFYDPLSKFVRYELPNLQMLHDDIVVVGLDRPQLDETLRALLNTHRVVMEAAPAQFPLPRVSQLEELLRLGTLLNDPSHRSDRDAFDTSALEFLDGLAVYTKEVQVILDRTSDTIKEQIITTLLDDGESD